MRSYSECIKIYSIVLDSEIHYTLSVCLETLLNNSPLFDPRLHEEQISA